MTFRLGRALFELQADRRGGVHIISYGYMDDVLMQNYLKLIFRSSSSLQTGKGLIGKSYNRKRL